MPTSGTGTRGFTLIELLVVLAIVGILVAVAAVNLFPSDEQRSRQEAAEVALAIERARDTAWFGGLPVAIALEDNRMRQWRLANDAWSDENARETPLPPAVRVAGVTLDGQPLRPGERLVFLSDGLATPFRVALDVRGLRWAVDGDAAGAVRLLRP